MKTRYCVICGERFPVYRNKLRAKTCSAECSDELHKRNIKKQNQRQSELRKANPKSPKPRQKKAPKVVVMPRDIDEVLEEMHKYNEKHGTKLSYGQYVYRVGI